MSKKVKDSEKPQPQETPTDQVKETAIEKPETKPDSLLAPLIHKNPEFQAAYTETIERVEQDMPTKMHFQNIMDALPEEFADSLAGIIQKTIGTRKGVYSDESQPLFPELRIYHGTGNDPNRPEKQLPGEYYITTKENVGEVFEGTVLAIWSGRTMWGDSDAGESVRMPICQSMDRKIGNNYGECETCHHKPWRGGQQQRCANDVVAFMLTRDMKEIVLVRFQKTSEPGGKMLLKFVRRSMEPWSKWYRITSKARTSKTDSNKRWFVMNIEPVGGDDGMVPESVHAFCDAMCSTLEATYILPNIANLYRQAHEEGDDDAPTAGGSAELMTQPDTKTEEDYGDMDDGPSV